MSMNRNGQSPGRGSGRSWRPQKTPVNVTVAAESQMITPAARTHGVDDLTIRPTTATASATYPTRRAQTAILQCALYRSSGGSTTPASVRAPRRRRIQERRSCSERATLSDYLTERVRANPGRVAGAPVGRAIMASWRTSRRNLASGCRR
jgi:hypothetical protein